MALYIPFNHGFTAVPFLPSSCFQNVENVFYFPIFLSSSIFVVSCNGENILLSNIRMYWMFRLYLEPNFSYVYTLHIHIFWIIYSKQTITKNNCYKSWQMAMQWRPYLFFSRCFVVEIMKISQQRSQQFTAHQIMDLCDLSFFSSLFLFIIWFLILSLSVIN